MSVLSYISIASGINMQIGPIQEPQIILKILGIKISNYHSTLQEASESAKILLPLTIQSRELNNIKRIRYQIIFLVRTITSRDLGGFKR